MKRGQFLWQLAVLCLLESQVSFAARSESLGDVANSISKPLQAMAGIIHIVCFVAAAGFLMGAFIRYMNHRRNPVETQLGSVIALLAAGLALLAVGFIPMPGMQNS